MTIEEIARRLEDAYHMTDSDEYPETYEMLDAHHDDEEDGWYITDAYDIANNLFYCDEDKPMMPVVADFVRDVYLEEIVNGNTEAATGLGSLFYTGRIGEQNYTKAMEYYQIAADGGDRAAQENLGYCYYYGRNCDVDYEKAFKYFSLGAFDGHIRSLYKIGDMYRNGYYVEKNEQEAYYIYQRCLDTMTDEDVPLVGGDVMMRMGDCYYMGIGCETDYRMALHFYQFAEQMFYGRLLDGDFLIKGCYENVIRKQQEVRDKMTTQLPDFSWTK